MSTINPDDIKKLDRCLISGSPVLFTGAGFSLGATRESGEKIPFGDELKMLIVEDLLGIGKTQDEFDELSKASLSDVCSFATTMISEYRLKDFIVEHLAGFRPQDYHETILSFDNWKKVYTVNIDDVVENSQCCNKYIVQNSQRKKEYSKANKTEYIKLHGCVRNTDGRIVFSHSQYVDSMLHSTDYRFSSFAQDMQVDNFVIIGTEMNEINQDYYIQLFKTSSDKTIHGQLFYINPKPSVIFKTRAKSIGATIIDWSAEEFANHLLTLAPTTLSNEKKNDIKGFLNVRHKFEREKTSSTSFKSELYFGDYPCYKDIVFDWDFINPDVENIIASIKVATDNKTSARLMYAFYGKSLVGKSVYLKRIAVSLLNENFAVYEFCGREFDIRYFAKCIKNIEETNVALIIDDASFYYKEIGALVSLFPLDRNLIIISAARSYAHFRKRYCLVSESWFEEILISGETVDECFAANIAERLDEKGLLGSLKADDKNTRIEKIKAFNDVSSFLYSITNGRHFQDRIISNYSGLSDKYKEEHNFLIQLSIFYKMNLPFFPREIYFLIYGENAKNIMGNIENYVTFFPEKNGYAIRNSFLVQHILGQVSYKKRVRLIAEVLMYVSPQVVDGYHSYWNEIASTLMKCRLLRRPLGLTNEWIKKLLFSIKNYYNDDYNYWLQVGLSEQYDGDFDLALNHFQQAESLSPNSYLVKNAIARNFLRQANVINDKAKADGLFNEGVRRMESLIREREEFQVRAYSTHCLLFERIRFYRKYDIIPDTDILQNMYKSLQSVFDKNPDDPMSKHISNVFRNFVEEKNLKNKLPKLTLQDLRIIKGLTKGDDMSEKDFVENFEIDE